MHPLIVKDLSKTFNKFRAVDSVSFDLKEGEILGFLGPNGAGKTTTLQMLMGALTPTSGEISYFGKSLFTNREEILEKINYSSTYTSLPWNLSVKENLTFISYFYKINNRKKRIEEICEIFKLQELMKQRVTELSAGQTTRVNLAKAFLNHPKILLLDEPTASLDPDIAKYLRDFILSQREEFKVSIIFTSHNMKEVEEICERVIFINKGKIIANDAPIKLAGKIDITQIELLTNDISKLEKFCNAKKIKISINNKYAFISLKEKGVPQFLKSLTEENISYEEISINKPTLEDYFLNVSLGKL